MRVARKRKRMEATAELNITAFLNLMVILVPFLLITAVFSRMTVLELNLPALNAQAGENEEIKLQLQVLVSPEQIIVQDANLGPIKAFALTDGGQPVGDLQRSVWKPFTETLIDIKSRFPQEQSIALLLDRQISYKLMIQLMDHVRSADLVQAGSLETVELFPEIAIGDIPEIVETGAEQAGGAS